MNTIRSECPFCQQPVELPAEDAKRGINCPGCFKFFNPRLAEINTPAPDPAKPNDSLLWRVSQIRDRAGHFRLASIIFAALGILSLLVSLVAAISDSAFAGFLICGGSLIGTAIWLYLIAQIIHIRANTEK